MDNGRRRGDRGVGLGSADAHETKAVQFRFTDYCVPRAQTQPLKAREVRNCLTDEGRPLGVGLQEQAPNHLRRLWPKATVVNAEGKGSDVTGSGDRQEEDRKGITDEVSKVSRRWPKPRSGSCRGRSSDETCL